MAARAQFVRIVATGGHSGLGFEALRQIFLSPPSTFPAPYHLILFVRSPDSVAVASSIVHLRQLQPGSRVEARKLDLASLETVRSASQELSKDLQREKFEGTGTGRADLFLLCAGAAKAKKETTEDGFEATLQVNHIAHWLLLSTLKTHIADQVLCADKTLPPTRIVFVSSDLHRRVRDVSKIDSLFDLSKEEWSGMAAYGASKLVQLASIQRWRREFEALCEERDQSGDGHEGKLELVSVTPGFVPTTGLDREMPWYSRLWMKSVMPFLTVIVTGISQAGEAICTACTAPLITVPHSTARPPSPAVTPSEDDGRRVRVAALDKRRELVNPDERVFDEAMQDKWWPKIA